MGASCSSHIDPELGVVRSESKHGAHRRGWRSKLPREAKLGETHIRTGYGKQSMKVYLEKQHPGAKIGITLRGECYPVVTVVAEDGVAAGKVHVGDIVLSVACDHPRPMKVEADHHAPVIEMLRSAVGLVRIKVLRKKPDEVLRVHKEAPQSLIGVRQATEVSAATNASPSTDSNQSPATETTPATGWDATESEADRRYRRLMRELQTRDITPDDYEILLGLDETVTKKDVISTDAIDGFLAEAVDSFRESPPADTGDMECAICVAEIDPEEEPAAKLCCGHVYHHSCIRRWLTTGKDTCPMCGAQQHCQAFCVSAALKESKEVDTVTDSSSAPEGQTTHRRASRRSESCC